MLYLIYIEFLLWLKRPHDWLYPVIFFLIVTCLFPLAFTPDPLFLEKYIPGCIWITTLFACLLSIQSIFDADFKEGFIEQMFLSDVPCAVLIFIRLSVQWLMTVSPLLLLVPLIALMFHLSVTITWNLFLSLLLGSPILVFLGCLGAALTLSMQQQSVLLSLLILPLLTPVLIFGVNIVQQAQAGLSVLGPASFLAGLSLLSILLLPLAIASILRLNLDD